MRRLGPGGILIAAVAVFSLFQAIAVTLGTTRAEGADRLTSFGLSLALLLWIVADARKRRLTPCYEFGFLVAVYFPLSLVWYVFWSRGWRGVIVLTALLGLTLFPSLAATAAWVLRYGLA